MDFTSENKIEMALIEQLISGISQWTYREDLTTEDDLWNNFRQKLEANNVAILDGVPLTEQEFLQVKNQLNFASFYDAAIWIAGENGVAKVEVQRENVNLGTIRLVVMSRQDIAGGISSYEVIRQYVAPKVNPLDQNRRFDVSLLINGLPMIHIELKNRAHPYMDAFNQIKKYITERKFRGIFSAVQMFVVSNGTDTRYIASAKETKLNDRFLTRWVDEKNEGINDILAFAKEVLSIPMAHKMVTQYTVIDYEAKNLILLRPYQIHAIEAVKKASRYEKSGYVWHTTGSGKTLTSYKVARNLLQIPSIEKTIFIVDRVDLDQQTTSAFMSYAENDAVEIDETDNVQHLMKRLISSDRSVIVTTIQKLNYVMKRFAGKEETKRYKEITQMRVAFVVDECHRAVTPEKKRELEGFFRRSLWYGFTGTPIFAENAKGEKGDLPRTTRQQYGERLHEYTVKEAIHDSAVLGFQVEYMSTFSEDELDDALIQADEKNELKIADMGITEKEALLPKIVYEKDEHLLKVLDFILNRSIRKLGLTKEGAPYSAILTTTSIAQAQRYYQLLKEVVAGNSTLQISERVKKLYPDFPKFAITYSISENKEASIDNQKQMKEALKDYNRLYETNFEMSTLSMYNREVNERLARKKSRYFPRNQQLDLVIVVDRLLTGFDAPSLSTLFMDRPPMKPHHLIQAFSRTNRLFDRYKKYGQIVTFQTPKLYEEKVKEALILYSNGGEDVVLAPDFETSEQAFLKAIKELASFVPSVEVVDGFTKAQKKKFVKLFQNFDRTYGAVQVYTDYEEENLGNLYPIVKEEIEELHGKYINVLEELKKEMDPKIEADININYQLESIKVEKINYEYILMLIQNFVPQEDELFGTGDEKAAKEINDYLLTLSKSNEKLAQLMFLLWEDLQKDPEKYRFQNVSEVLQEMIQEKEQELIQEEAEKWGLREDTLTYVVSNYNTKKSRQSGENELRETADYDLYKQMTENPLPKLRYWSKGVKPAIHELYEREIQPLEHK